MPPIQRIRQNRLIRDAIINYLSDPLLYGISTRVLVSKVYDKLKLVLPQLNEHHIWGNLSYVLRYAAKLRVRSPGYSLIA